MARVIEMDGKPLALLVDGESGQYLVPPIVMDKDENILIGAEVLEAIVKSGVMTVEVPVYRNVTPAYLARIDAELAQVRNELGVEFGSL